MAGFRTVVIQSPCKLTYKDGFLIIRGDEVRTVHISEENYDGTLRGNQSAYSKKSTAASPVGKKW